MRAIPTRIHGVLDYLSGLLFIASPWLFDFANGGVAQWTPIFVGTTLLIVSLLTDYELSLVKKIPMPTHLAIDMIAGGLLAASPWLFGFGEWVFWPHLLFGLFEIGAGMLTRQVPDYRDNGVVIDEDPDDPSDTRGKVINIERKKKDGSREERNLSKDEELPTPG